MKHKIVNCPHCGKIIPDHILKGESTRKTVTCPECGSQKNYKAGMRYTARERFSVTSAVSAAAGFHSVPIAADSTTELWGKTSLVHRKERYREI